MTPVTRSRTAGAIPGSGVKQLQHDMDRSPHGSARKHWAPQRSYVSSHRNSQLSEQHRVADEETGRRCDELGVNDPEQS